MRYTELATALRELSSDIRIAALRVAFRRGRNCTGPSSLFRPTPLSLAILAAIGSASASADEVPVNNYSTPFQIRAGDEKTFVGGTVISPTPPYPAQLGGTGIQVFGGTAILDPKLGLGTPIRINVNGDAIDGLYVSGGLINVNPGGTYICRGWRRARNL